MLLRNEVLSGVIVEIVEKPRAIARHCYFPEGEQRVKMGHLTRITMADLDAELLAGGVAGLNRLSTTTKFAFSLNQITRVAVSSCYDRVEDGKSVYVVDIYLQAPMRGLPVHSVTFDDSSAGGSRSSPDRTSNSSGMRLRQATRVSEHDELDRKPDYQIEYRYSEFRALRTQIQKLVGHPYDELQKKCCKYCLQLQWVAHFVSFPSRSFIDGVITGVGPLKRMRTKARQSGLTDFMNELLHTAKEAMYQIQDAATCQGFLSVSQVLTDFLAEPTLRNSCAA